MNGKDNREKNHTYAQTRQEPNKMNAREAVLLDANEPGAYEVIRTMGESPIVIVCDHASNRIPERLNNLGLSDAQLASHIAWDAGAAELARKLSARLDAALILSNYSRLVIDCNRPAGHPESILSQSDNTVVPGNAEIDKLEAARRSRTLLDPYQQAIASVISRRDRDNVRLLSIHSFTPSLHGEERPWSIGVCYNHTEQVSSDWARKMLTGLRTRVNPAEDEVGDNQPYEVTDDCDFTQTKQGRKPGIPNLMLELRQDKISDDLMVQRWCNIIAGCCEYSD